jgi:glycerol-3-phosphate dehydrogenase
MYDAVIIGAGISGASLARELCRYKLRIAVLEKGNDVCAGASKSNSATVHSGHDATFGTKKAYYNVLGNAMYERLCAELSVPFVRNGMIVFAANETDMAEVRRLKANADRNGVPGTRVLDREDLIRLEGYFGEDVTGGLFAPSSGITCPYSLVIALCENAFQNGAAFFLNTEVRRIERSDTGFHISTNRGSFEAGYVFNCAGTHADDINNMISERKFTILPRKGEHLILDKKLAPYVKATVSQTPVTLPGGGHTKGMGIMPSADGTIILGCDAHDAADKDDLSTTRAGIGEVLEYFERNWRNLPISRLYSEFPKNMVIGSFAGLRPHPDTDDFIIGEADDVPGFYNVAGIESPGLTAAPAIAQDLARQAAEKYGFIKNQNFDPIRICKKPFRDMTPEERRQAIIEDPDYGKIICRCEQVTKAEILAAIRSPIGAKTVNAVKMRTRAGMGRCQGGFCGPEIVRMLSGELGIPMTEVTLCGEGSEIVPYETCLQGES